MREKKQSSAEDFETINKGNLAEQFAGTEILKYQNPRNKTQLYYWHREKRGSTAEVDYIIQKSENILPVEIKSGSQGKMQSLWMFLNEKNRKNGIRISLENFSSYSGIHVYPLYGIMNIFDEDLSKANSHYMPKPDHKHCDRAAQLLLQTFRWVHGIKNASREKITDIPNIDRLAQVEKIHARHDGFDSRSDSPVLVTHRGEPM